MISTHSWFQQKRANSGNALASLLIGAISPGSGGADVNVFYATLGKYIAPYIQDDWKLAHNRRLPGSPSGTRFSRLPRTDPAVRKISGTVSSPMLPTRCT